MGRRESCRRKSLERKSQFISMRWVTAQRSRRYGSCSTPFGC
jgi:hypothetical protein